MRGNNAPPKATMEGTVLGEAHNARDNLSRDPSPPKIARDRAGAHRRLTNFRDRSTMNVQASVRADKLELQRAAREAAYAMPLEQFHPGAPQLFRNDTLWPD